MLQIDVFPSLLHLCFMKDECDFLAWFSLKFRTLSRCYILLYIVDSILKSSLNVNHVDSLSIRTRLSLQLLSWSPAFSPFCSQNTSWICSQSLFPCPRPYWDPCHLPHCCFSGVSVPSFRYCLQPARTIQFSRLSGSLLLSDKEQSLSMFWLLFVVWALLSCLSPGSLETIFLS